jgi:bifunctional N-acetylglucosamine-1-phosphate-uridyltransferase/glucosamine-1-phosphate-acetyltransferase GlmU-like protein
MNDVVAVIMAGGLGKRIGKNIPKVLLEVDGIPMIVRILLNLQELNYLINVEKVIVVVGKYKDQIKEVIDKYINYIPEVTYVTQEEALGTGHALMCCNDELLKHPKSDVLILSGDVPMLRVHTMRKLVEIKSAVKMITTKLEYSSGYGRIVLKDDKFDKIVEHKDCSQDELEIKQINAGIYCIKAKLLSEHFQYLTNNNKQNEYYLTDLIEIIKIRTKANIELYNIEKERIVEILGVNTLEQLKELEDLMKQYEASDKIEFNELKNKIDIKNEIN